MSKAKLFLPITKVDVAKRLVYGQATAEVVDKADEIMDYAGTKPLFEEWSGAIAKATDGKSVGNVRAMHGKVAAGKLTDSFHFLRLGKLLFEITLLGGVEHVNDGGFLSGALLGVFLLDRSDIEARPALALPRQCRVNRRDLAFAFDRARNHRLERRTVALGDHR